ncbi:MAG TPA: biotin--[acetyl-CoA-carboxylase] ligase [Puia sp.]|nr:biotin--[acetyl-CoA-carboxylase] ligase [Puia sp.]
MAHPTIKLTQQTGGPIGHPFIELSSVDSTNNYAMGKVHAGLASHGMVVFAHEQTAGKGQRGKTWTSSPGKNIMLSAVLEPASMLPGQQFSLSMAIALACYDLLHAFVPAGLSIKWPNDLYWRDRKAGGILIESVCKGQAWLFAVAGIGININQIRFSKDAARAVSLKQITGSEFSVSELTRELCHCLNKRYSQLLKQGITGILFEYNQLLFKRDQLVELKTGGRLLQTTISKVTEHGRLITYDSEERIFDFGEVEWVL